MNSKIYYYARVSTTEQNLNRQLDIFHSLGAENRDIITDKQSGKDLE
ncbi:MAG: recombinase family protein [Eubacteriales bacterium]|nr:recombinase family protein [Eubacteriales bacterium]